MSGRCEQHAASFLWVLSALAVLGAWSRPLVIMHPSLHGRVEDGKPGAGGMEPCPLLSADCRRGKVQDTTLVACY